MDPLTRRRFLRQIGFGAGAWTLLAGGARFASAADGAGLPRSTPEAEGVASAGLLAFLEAIAAQKQELHSFMMLRHGKVVAEGWWSPYAPGLRHTLYSLSKSFTSTAVGLAVAEGKLRVDDRVVKFFPDSLPESVSENLAAMRIRDLLTMSAGHATEPMPVMVKQEDWVKSFLAWPVPQAPGSEFLYNSAATYMLSAIVQKLTGQKIVDYLQPRLFDPLGIEGAAWETCPRGINTGGWGLSVHTEDLAKFGQLYLQKGAWNGRQIIPDAWVEEATTFKIQQPLHPRADRTKERDDWQQGYCYQFWRCTHDAFRGDGAFGQFAVELPAHDVVIVMTGESSNLQGELDLVWEHLLPAIKDASLPADPAAATQLREKLAALALPPPQGQAATASAERLSGRTFRLEPNDLGLLSATFRLGPDASLVTFRDAEAEYPIACGVEQWQQGETMLPGTPPRLVTGGAPPRGTKHRLAASSAWKNDRTLELTWRYIETPHHDTVTCTFEGDTVKVEFLSSIAQRNAKPHDPRPVLRGTAAPG